MLPKDIQGDDEKNRRIRQLIIKESPGVMTPEADESYCYIARRIGLGCARMGSMRGPDPLKARALIDQAYERGVRLFDTANSYAQGDSESILGNSLKNRHDVMIVTKLGKQVPLKARLLKPVKNLVRGLVKRSAQTEDVVRRARGGLLPVSFDVPVLRRQLDLSRRRLRRDCLPMVMLHSPTAEVLHAGHAVDFIEKAQNEGALEHIGVSVDDLEAAEACLSDPRIQMIQAPLHHSDQEMRAWAARAGAQGRHVVAREVFRQAVRPNLKLRPETIEHLLNTALDTPGIKTCLIGTTNPTHLDQLLQMAQVHGSSSNAIEVF
ncbi:aldo/keto reductase [Pseudophaeobacter sp.]|uniref:aldo/keto reductase n=1 Tax=Pseudophaeobacter sp. TaxID=1971739 RepID=UPI003298D679